MIESASFPEGAHLVLLVHGLWGNPSHLANLAGGLRAKHDESTLCILVAKSNTSNFTYDGIEVGGERVARELEDELQRLEGEGVHVTKLSIVGYSLGGLIARYCVGLLHARGLLDRVAPVNFTAFASPFLGVRSPQPNYRSRLFNLLGPQTLSTSGKQLFVADSFRDTGRPLLSVLADPDSVFMRGLARFSRRVIYANVQNDRSAPFWTTGLAARDPFEDLDTVDLRFVRGYEPVVADPDEPVQLKRAGPHDTSFWARVKRGGEAFTANLPFYAFSTFILPFGLTFFLVNAGLQSVRSSRRIRLHNTEEAGAGFGVYRIPLMAEGALEALNARAPRRHLTGPEAAAQEGGALEKRTDVWAHFPKLALMPEQLEMIENLDDLGFKKYPVLISKVRHSHAAIIVRFNRAAFEEGHTVIKHWMEEEFEV